MAVLPGLIPSTILGVVKPLFQLQRQGEIEFRVVLNKLCLETYIRWADVLVLSRNCEPKDLRIIFLAQKHNKKVVYEIDDNFFQISLETELGRYHRNPVRLFVIQKILECCDRVHVYSESLYDIASQFNKNVKKVRPYFDFSIIEKTARSNHSDIVKIAYSTSRTGYDSLSIIFDSALSIVLEKYSHVQAFFWGHMSDRFKRLTNVKLMSYEADYNRFVRLFYKEGFDIGLAPMVDDEFHRSKTNNKFREYGGCEVAGIYSNVPLYADCVQDGLTGLLVNNTEREWKEALERLILNHELRNRIRNNARAYVADHYPFEDSINTWRQTFEEVEEKRISYNSLKGYPFHRIKAAILIDKNCINQVKVDFSRINLLLEALDGLHFKKFFLTIPFDMQKKSIIQMVDKLKKQHDVLICLASKPELRECLLKSMTSATVPVFIDFANDPITDVDQLRKCPNRGLHVVTSRNNDELQDIDVVQYICDLSPSDLEVYYSLRSPVCRWLEIMLDLEYCLPSSIWPPRADLPVLDMIVRNVRRFTIGTETLIIATNPPSETFDSNKKRPQETITSVRFCSLAFLKNILSQSYHYLFSIIRYSQQVRILLAINFRKKY